jgi:hypothetical protein
MTERKVIDGEVVAAPRILAAEPAGRSPDLRCDTHPDWMDCQLSTPDCVAFMQPRTEPGSGAFRFTDRRRLSYPRLRHDEH